MASETNTRLPADAGATIGLKIEPGVIYRWRGDLDQILGNQNRQERLARLGIGPKFTRIGRDKFSRGEWVLDYIDALAQRSTSDQPGGNRRGRSQVAAGAAP